MENKKGFTLVELLAVISILALLVIVAMPKVLELFNESKQNTFEVEMTNIFNTAKTTFISESISDSKKKLYCNTPGCQGKPLDMDMPDNLKYSIKLNKNGEVMCFQATNGSFYYVSQGVTDSMNFTGLTKYTTDSTTDFVPDCYFSVDYKDIKRINVINIYPDKTNSEYPVETNPGTYEGCDRYKKYKSSALKSWMETPSVESSNGYGKGIIKVIPVSFTEFNSNPNPDFWVKKYYNDNCIPESENDPKLNRTTADLLYIGTWDANAQTPYSDDAIEAIDNWTDSGKPIIAGHDVLIMEQSSSKTLTEKILRKFGMKSEGAHSPELNRVHILSNKKRNVFTLWPWIIIDGEEGLKIHKTHTTSQKVVEGEIWITLGKDKITEEEAKKKNLFYLATYNNTAIIQTGHSNASAEIDEQKIIANTIFFMYYKHVLKENGEEL